MTCYLCFVDKEHYLTIYKYMDAIKKQKVMNAST